MFREPSFATKWLLILIAAFGVGFWVAAGASGCQRERDEPLPEVELSGGELPEESGGGAAELREEEPDTVASGLCTIPDRTSAEPDCT